MVRTIQWQQEQHPKIGLNTFPNVLDVSMIPKPVLTCFSSLYKSPTHGITTGIAPAAPIP